MEIMQDWTPDGNQLVFELEEACYLMPYLAPDIERISWESADAANKAIERAMMND